MLQLQDPSDLALALRELLSDSQRCQAMGVAGQQVVADNRGALAQLLALVAGLMSRE